MSTSKTIAALFLSLLLALSTTASVAHNLYYHSTDIQQNDFSNHFVDYGHYDHDEHEGHEGHDESGCVFTFIQYSESLLAHEIPAVSLSVFGSKKLNSIIATQPSRPNNGFFARAPPYSV
ncbi:MAG: hypothetical protein ACPHOH_03680 [Porticoccaceae bacterium]